MKIHGYIFAAAVLLMSASCDKDVPASKDGKQIVTFSASFDNSKVTRNDGGKSEWEKGDAIKVYYGAGSYVTATAQSGGTSATFVTDSAIPVDCGKYIAVYPAARTYKFTSGVFEEESLNIDYEEPLPATFANAAVCSATTNVAGGSLAFRNRCAILKFTTSSKKIHSATYISGESRAYGIVGAQNIGYKAGTYYIPIPAGDDQTFSLRLKDYEGWDYPALVKGPLTLEASHIYNIGTVEDSLFDESTAGSTSMRLLSFNILRGDLQGPDHLWTGRKDACLAMLKANNPDLFGLMECNSVQRDDILNTFPKYGRVGLAVNGTVYDYPSTSSNPIFYDGSKMLLEEWGTYWLSDNPEAKGSYTWYYDKPRCLTWARFKLKQTDTRFIYIAVHLQDNLSSIKKVYEGQESKYGPLNRQKSVALIKQLITNKINPNGLPMMFSGDLNATYNSSELEGLYDIVSLAANIATTADKGNTFNSFTSETGKSRIDHIFCNGCKVRSFAVDRSTYGGVQYISDHWPVYADFTLILPPSDEEFNSSLEGWSQDNI